MTKITELLQIHFQESSGYKRVFKLMEEWNIPFFTLTVTFNNIEKQIQFGPMYSANRQILATFKISTNIESKVNSVILIFNRKNFSDYIKKNKLGDFCLKVIQTHDKPFNCKVNLQPVGDIINIEANSIVHSPDNNPSLDQEIFSAESAEISTIFKTSDFLETVTIHSIGRFDMQMQFTDSIDKPIIICSSNNDRRTVPIKTELTSEKVYGTQNWSARFNTTQLLKPLTHIQKDIGGNIHFRGKRSDKNNLVYGRLDNYQYQNIEMTVFIAAMKLQQDAW